MVFYASMKDDSRPILESVRISIQDDKIRFDAVNGYVAARFMATVNQDIFVESFSEAVIPAWVVKQLLGDRQVKASEKITLVKSKKAVVTKCGEIIILSNELNGEFMDMENFFKLADLTLICDMASVTEIMKKVELVSSSAGYEKTSAPLVLDYDPDDGRLNFRISSSTSVLEDSIECEANGELKTVHMGFNPSFLKQAIWQVDTDKIGFNFGSNLSPLVILPQYEKEDFSAVHIVVPVRIKQAEESEKNA
jgi:DNA polymerase-3 subunit beta